VLTELRVRQLGVIDDVTLALGPGMTALTGETGAGKTLVVEAIELLLGGRADPVLVRAGAGEAIVEGRFTASADRWDGGDRTGSGDGRGSRDGRGSGEGRGRGGRWDEEEGDDLVLARVIPAEGRSRAYLGGQMASLGLLGEAGRARVDLHGQHTQQSLLAPAAQRGALDRAGGIDHGPLLAARARLRAVEEARSELGGDARSRARELDLLRFQLEELDGAALDDPDEDAVLAEEEERLGDSETLRRAVLATHEALSGDDGVLDQLGSAVAGLAGRRPVEALHDRLHALEAELADAASDSRAVAEGLEDDPARLEAVSARRHLLHELRRKYGETLAEVIAFRDEARQKVADLESYEQRAAQLDTEAEAASAEVRKAQKALGAARRAAAPALAAAVEAALRVLALPRARFEVNVGDDPAGEDVTWLLAANPGEPLLPLTKVASGGELARTMLAARLVLSGTSTALGAPAATNAPGGRAKRAPEDDQESEPRTLIFDEVDAGIGGEAAVAVGRALAALGHEHQVLVVTHLPQVAAFARRHLAVSKVVAGERTTSKVTELDQDARVIELSRMLSGQPQSATARRHAEELLADARSVWDGQRIG
jgi:DNA repair protein RecN (Recombination protein N)